DTRRRGNCFFAGRGRDRPIQSSSAQSIPFNTTQETHVATASENRMQHSTLRFAVSGVASSTSLLPDFFACILEDSVIWIGWVGGSRSYEVRLVGLCSVVLGAAGQGCRVDSWSMPSAYLAR